MSLEVRNLNKKYGDIQALKNVNMKLDNGVYGLLGPNGAGKSTLINLLTDNIKRDNGEIFWKGTEIRKLGEKYRDILGYMPQQQGYYEDFSAGAFLIYIGQLKGMRRRDAKRRAMELLKIVNLDQVRKKKIGGFSGGMKQRLLLAQALMNDPSVLILDEPTAGVDPQERIRIRNFISEIAKDRVVIIATHIVSDVESIANEIIIMKDGEIIDKEPPYQLLEKVKNYVYEIEIEDNQLQEIQKQYVVSNLRNVRNGLAVKIIADEPPKDILFKKPDVNLEDAYLYFFGKQG